MVLSFPSSVSGTTNILFVSFLCDINVYLYNKSNNSEELLLIGIKFWGDCLSYLLDQIIQRIVVIDTIGCNVCHCIVQAAHGAFLSCGIVLCYSCLHISLLSCLPLFCKGTTFFWDMQIFEQENVFLRHFSFFPISTHYVNVRFCFVFRTAAALFCHEILRFSKMCAGSFVSCQKSAACI